MNIANRITLALHQIETLFPEFSFYVYANKWEANGDVIGAMIVSYDEDNQEVDGSTFQNECVDEIVETMIEVLSSLTDEE